MVMKTLKRSIIIRDSDLDKVLSKSIKQKLYDRVDVTPMTYKSIQQEYIMATLTNPNDRIPKFNSLPNVYEDMLYREQCLYDRRYLGWIFTMDYPDGQIYVQSSVKQVKQPMYRVTFERDYG